MLLSGYIGCPLSPSVRTAYRRAKRILKAAYVGIIPTLIVSYPGDPGALARVRLPGVWMVGDHN
jgi:hypothetical protein